MTKITILVALLTIITTGCGPKKDKQAGTTEKVDTAVNSKTTNSQQRPPEFISCGATPKTFVVGTGGAFDGAAQPQRTEPWYRITDFRPHGDAISADSIQSVTETCLLMIMPEIKHFEDEESEDANAWFTAMDDWVWYSYHTRELFEGLGVKIIDTGKRYLSFALAAGGTIIVDAEDEQNGYHVNALLYKTGRMPIAIDITDADRQYIYDYLGDVIYSKYQEDDGYTTVEECTYLNRTMRQVYRIVRLMDGHLKDELPAADLSYGSLADDNVEITCIYKTPKQLHIELFYNGGMTTVELIENESGTTSRITCSAD